MVVHVFVHVLLYRCVFFWFNVFSRFIVFPRFFLIATLAQVLGCFTGFRTKTFLAAVLKLLLVPITPSMRIGHRMPECYHSPRTMINSPGVPPFRPSAFRIKDQVHGRSNPQMSGQSFMFAMYSA